MTACPRPAKRRRTVRRSASILVLVAISLTVILIGVAFSVDVAFTQLAKSEMKAVCDLSSMAAVEALTRTQDVSKAKKAAKDVAKLHAVGGETFHLDNSDIVFGRHRAVAGGRYEFDAGLTPFTAVRVTGRRQTSAANAPIQSFFGGFFGVSDFELEMASTTAQLDRDIALVLDISTSMTGSRFNEMIVAANAFVDEIENTIETERVMIVSYNGGATTNQSLTEDPVVMRSAINSLAITTSGTGIGEGLLRATDNLYSDPLKRPLAQGYVILMTDGEHNTGIEPIDVVPVAAARHHIVNTITFSVDANQADMQAVANSGGGFHRHADGGTDLIAVFQEMANSLDLQLTD